MLRRIVGTLARHRHLIAVIARLASPVIVLVTAVHYLATSEMTYAEASRHSSGYDLEYLFWHVFAAGVIMASLAWLALVLAFSFGHRTRLARPARWQRLPGPGQGQASDG